MEARTFFRGGALCGLVLLFGVGCSSGGNTVTQARCPCSLELVSGDGQTGAPGAQLPDRLVVRLTDRNGNGVLGALILWEVTAGGGRIEPDCIPGTCPNGGTDPSGFNRADWTLGGTEGIQTVSVTSLQASDVITFSAEVTGS